jgi:hypothetical protein
VTSAGDTSSGDALLTLEPLIETVRAGVEGRGWSLSGLQKTTSHEFEGRWEGESTRSAYLFFHSERAPEDASVDVYLDETTRGLTGNLALVVDLVPLADLGEPAEALRVFGALATAFLPADHTTPVTLRLRLQEGDADPAKADTEVRFKIRIPRRTVLAGGEAVRRLAASSVDAFERILASAELARFTVVT